MYKQCAGEFYFDSIHFPVSFKAIDNFEMQNLCRSFGYDGVKKGEDEEDDVQKYILSGHQRTQARDTYTSCF